MRVLHFVTGGFSGATQVAIDLCLAARHSPGMQVLLVLRRKRNTDAARVQALRDQGLDVRVVPGWAHLATVLALRSIALQWKPDILVAHGFSEHLWGRYAGLLAHVQHLVHVEHNSRERYTRWRLAQARWLAKRTDAIVGVTESVRQYAISLGFPREKCITIPNGIKVDKFPASGLVPWEQREPAIVMAARFARQKDHPTLIRALSVLAKENLHPTLYLAGGGKASIRKECQELARDLGLEKQIQFLGHIDDLPAFLMKTQINVLSTHYEGMGLSLVEGMAAGCACIGTDVAGVRDVIDHGRNGMLVPENDAVALAAAIRQLLTDATEAKLLSSAAREQAIRAFALDRMQTRYQATFEAIQSGQPLPH